METGSKVRDWTDWSVGDWAVGRAGAVRSSGRISQIDDERRLIWVGARAFRPDQVSTG